MSERQHADHSNRRPASPPGMSLVKGVGGIGSTTMISTPRRANCFKYRSLTICSRRQGAETAASAAWSGSRRSRGLGAKIFLAAIRQTMIAGLEERRNGCKQTSAAIVSGPEHRTPSRLFRLRHSLFWQSALPVPPRASISTKCGTFVSTSRSD